MAVEWDAASIRAKIEAAAMRGVVTGAAAVQDDGTRRIQSPPKTGRIYVRRGVSHQASAPGEAPANDTGRLANSTDIRYDVPALAAYVNWAAGYARSLEYGTERMDPRPFARPSLTAQEGTIRAAVSAEIAQVLKS
jgi:HK97 gp10 family phage protein